MAKIVRRRRGSTEDHANFTGDPGEITVDLTEKTVRVHDGSIVSGVPLAKADMTNVSDSVGITQLAVSDGSAGQVLSTNGAGQLSFVGQTDVVVGGDISGTVGNAQIVAGTVGTPELADNAVVSAKIGTGEVQQTHLATNSVGTAQLQLDAVTVNELSPMSVEEAKIQTGAVTNTKIADNAVTTVKILDANVTEPKIADNAVTTNKIANGNVTVDKLASSGVLPALDGSNLIGIEGVPAGIIAIWSGSIATIPNGWVICDGTNSTPDLRDRFVIGAGGGQAVDATGGSTSTGAHTLTIAEMPSHTHAGQQSGGARADGDNQKLVGTGSTTGATGGSGSHTHTGTLPPFYALAYIMKT